MIEQLISTKLKLGLTYIENGNKDEGLKEIESAILLDPTNEEANKIWVELTGGKEICGPDGCVLPSFKKD